MYFFHSDVGKYLSMGIQTKRKDLNQTKGVHISTHFVLAVLAGLLFFFFCNTGHSMKRSVTLFYLFLLNGKRWKKLNSLVEITKNWGYCRLTQFMNKNSDKLKEQLETVWSEGWSLKLGRQATTADYTFTCHHKQEDIRLKVL